LKDFADSSKERLYEDDDDPTPGLPKKQLLSISSPEKVCIYKPPLYLTKIKSITISYTILTF
jgi:hypothetical protein